MYRTLSDIVPAPSLRARITRRGKVLLPAALAALGVAQVAHAGHAVSSWVGPLSGNWTTASMWSAGVPSNVGTNTFDAVIGVSGSPFTVTLGNNIGLTSFTLSSADATVNHTNGVLTVANPIQISAGTYLLNGGTISGGTVNLSGSGVLGFGSGAGKLDGTVVNGGLTFAGAQSWARLMNGARFTGDAVLSANSSLLNFEYDATIQNGQTITLDSVGATLGVARNSTTTLDSTLTLAAGAIVHGRGNISSGNFTSGSTNTVVNNGTVAADVSGGQLTINPNIFINNNVLQSTGGATLTLSGGSFTNNGSVSANGATAVLNSTNWTNAVGKTISAANGTITTGGTWSNAGSISINNSTLNLGGTFTTAGMNLANFSRVGGTVNLTGTLDDTGATLPLTAATGTWRMNGGTIKGGTITRAGGADLVFTNVSNILDGATVMGDLAIAESSAIARMKNGADFTGNATITGTGGIINYEYDATIGAGQTISLDGASASLGISKNDTTQTDSTLTIAPGAAVRGRGQITSGNFTSGTSNHVVNNGTITADLSGQILTINPNRFTNNAHTRAISGSTLTVSAGSWSNAAGGSISIDGSTANFQGNWSSPGALNLANGATLNMSGTFSTSGLNLAGISRTGSTTINLSGSLNNAGSTLALNDTTGSWRLSGGSISGGTITRAGSADLIFTIGGGALVGTTIPGDITFTENNSRVSMRDGADFTGNATLAATGALLNYEYDATIGGGRTINLDGVAATLGIASGGTPAADRTLTIASGAMVRGRGQVSSGNLTGGTANRVVNNGTIAADVSGQSLSVNPNLFTNNAALRATGGSTLSISAGSWSNAATGSISIDNSTGTFGGVWSNAGSIILNNATLNMGGTMTSGGLGLANFTRSGASTINLVGALDNNGATLTLGSSSGPIRLNGGTITGGTIVRSGSGELVFTQSGVLVGTNIIGDISVTESNARARMQNGADFTGNATLASTGSMLNYEYDATIGSGRTINLDGPAAMLSVARNVAAGTDSMLTIAPGATVRGRGSIASSQFTGGSTNHVINNGLIHSDTNAGLNITPNRFTNNGTVQASNGGSVSISNTVFTNGTGRLRATGGGKVRAFTMAGNLNDSLADGAGSQIDLDGASYTINQPLMVTNGAQLYLRGGWQKSADINLGGTAVFDYASGAPSPFDSIKSQIASGYNNGAWNGAGINSSQAASNSAYGLGYAESHTLFPSGVGGTFAGVSVDDHAVLVAYTRYGDTDLNGAVNLTDFNRLAANFGQTGKLWTDGDFNYDGLVNLTDFNRLAGNFGLSAGPDGPTPEDWSNLSAAVPEPTAAVMALWGLVPLCRRRTRRSR